MLEEQNSRAQGRPVPERRHSSAAGIRQSALPGSVNLADRPGLINDERGARIAYQLFLLLQQRFGPLCNCSWVIGADLPQTALYGSIWKRGRFAAWFQGLLAELRDVDFDALLEHKPRALRSKLDKRHAAGRLSMALAFGSRETYSRVLAECVLSLNPAGQTRLPSMTEQLGNTISSNWLLIAIELLPFAGILLFKFISPFLLLPYMILIMASNLRKNDIYPGLAILALYIAFSDYYLPQALPADPQPAASFEADGFDSQVYSERPSLDKHHYVDADLDKLDSRMLQQRLLLIDNPLAQGIATELWQRLRRHFHSIDLLDSDPKYRPSLRMLCGMEGQALLRQLNRMERFRFTGLIMEGPDFVERCLENLHPFQRLLFPPPRLNNTHSLANILVEYLEFFGNEQRRFSWRFGTISNFLLLLAAAILLLLLIGLIPDTGELILSILSLMFAPIFIFLIWGLYAFQQNAEQRLLALYVSFTDELVRHELSRPVQDE